MFFLKVTMKLCIASLIQLFTEPFPVSSSGHVKLFGLLSNNPLSDAALYFLHAPTIIILAIFLRKRWTILVRHPWRCRFVIGRLMVLGLAAEVPTAIMYGIFQKYPTDCLPLWLGFAVTAFSLLSIWWCQRARTFSSRILPWQAMVIGLAQGVALMPGISRLGLTYTAGRWLGLTSRMSFLFSLTIAWPIMTAEFFKDIFMGQLAMPSASFIFVICLIIGMIISYVGMLLMNRIVLKEKVWAFGWYMIVPLSLALLSWLL